MDQSKQKQLYGFKKLFYLANKAIKFKSEWNDKVIQEIFSVNDH